jgi:hypothetical protein
MRMHATILSGALALAIMFVAAAPPRAASSESGDMVQYVQTTTALLPDGSIPSPHTTTITASAQRERTDDEFGTNVIECDRQRSISWREREGTYAAESFEEMAARYAEITAAMKASGESETSATVQDEADAKTTIIDGITAHHLVETVSSPMGTSESDVWYAPNADPFTCPTLDAMVPSDLITTSAQGGSGGMSISAGGLGRPRVPPGSLMLRDSMRLGPGISIVIEVTSIKTLPYDPSYFEPPASYIQASPQPLPGLPPR